MSRTLRKIPQFYQDAFKLYCDQNTFEGVPLKGVAIGIPDLFFFLSRHGVNDVRPKIQQAAEALFEREKEAKIAFLRKVAATDGPEPTAVTPELTRLNQLRTAQRQLQEEITRLGRPADEAGQAALASKQRALPAMQKQLAEQALKIAFAAYKQSPALGEVAQQQLRIQVERQVRENQREAADAQDAFRASLMGRSEAEQKQLLTRYENQKAATELEHIHRVRMLFAEAGIAFEAELFKAALTKAKLEQDAAAREKIWQGFIAARANATAHELAEMQRQALENEEFVRQINDGLMRNANDIPHTEARNVNRAVLGQLPDALGQADFNQAFGQAHADAVYNRAELGRAKIWNTLDASQKPEDVMVIDTRYHGVPAPTNGLKKVLTVPGSDPPIHIEMIVQQDENGELHFQFQVPKTELEGRGVITQGAVSAWRGVKGLFKSEPEDPIRKLMQESGLTREQMAAKAIADAMEVMCPGEKSKPLTISGPDEHKQGFVEGFAGANKEIQGLDETTANQMAEGIGKCKDTFSRMDQARDDHWDARIQDTIKSNKIAEAKRLERSRQTALAQQRLNRLQTELDRIKTYLPQAGAPAVETLGPAPGSAAPKGYTQIAEDSVSTERDRLARIAKDFAEIKKHLPSEARDQFEADLKKQQEAFEQTYPRTTFQKAVSYIPFVGR